MKNPEPKSRKLSPEQEKVLKEKATERPFTGKWLYNREKGVYVCAACGQELFSSDAKFDSGTGWPSFDSVMRSGSVKTRRERDGRTEVTCAKCGSHLGHMFDDGPTKTGMRYCINSLALDFDKKGPALKTEKATFGAGCFWHVEEAFSHVKGVVGTTAGYAGGTLKNPTYEDVSSHKTGHAEVVHVEYDPQKVSYKELLDAFWGMHDPTQVDRQGPDVGSQYRSVIFYHTPEQKAEALSEKGKLQKSGRYRKPIATRIEEAGEFWRAEEYHQKYLAKRGLKTCGI